jgi:hypothetical protein
VSRVLFLCVLAVGGAFAQLACSPSSGVPTPAAATPAPVVAVPPPAALPAGPRAEGEAFEVGLEPPAGAKVGEAATARVVVKARGPYHVNRDYPMSFRPDTASTAAFDGEKVALGEGAERTPCADHPGEACAVSAPLRFTARTAGEARLAGTVAFSVCNPERCLIEKVPLATTFAAR